MKKHFSKLLFLAMAAITFTACEDVPDPYDIPGKGTSVLEMVSAYEKATGVKIKYEIKPRRAGDVAESYAATNKAKEELGFECDYTILDACKHGYEFQKANKVELKCTKNN